MDKSENCICITDKVEAQLRSPPPGLRYWVEALPGNPQSPKIPVVNTERCIAAAHENLVSAVRPFSAIYVEGHIMHRTVRIR